MAGPLRGQAEAVELTEETDGVVGDVDHFPDSHFRLTADLAHLDGQQGGQVSLLFPQGGGQVPDHQAPTGRRHLAPVQEASTGLSSLRPRR